MGANTAPEYTAEVIDRKWLPLAFTIGINEVKYMEENKDRTFVPSSEKWTLPPASKEDLIRPEYSEKHFTMHTHIFNEIAVVTKGESTMVSYDNSQVMSSPFLAFYPANVPHMQMNKSIDGYNRYLFRFAIDRETSENLSENDLLALNNCRSVFCTSIDSAECKILAGAAEILINLKGDEINERRLCMDIVIKRLCKFLRTNNKVVTANVGEGRGKQYFGSLVSYISEHYSEKITIDSLASRFYISRAKLVRDFRSVMSMSLNEYILLIRIANSKAMLLRDKPLCEVAESCGFGSTSYFIHCFKTQTGATPSQYVRFVASHPERSIDRTVAYKMKEPTF